MSLVTPPRTPSAPAAGTPPSNGAKPGGGQQPGGWMAAILTAVAAVAVAVGLVVTMGGTGTHGSTTPTTTVPPSTTTPPSTTVPPVAPVALSSAVYPTPSSTTRFSHPVAAARAFAVDFVGFSNPLVGSFVSSGGQAGTVAVRSSSTGVTTTVSLHRITGTWWVLGSATPNIRLDSPTPSQQVASPVRLQGVSTAFEAQVNVEVRQDGQQAPIGSGYVMGGSMGEMAPFDRSVPFAAPSAARGALVLFTVSMATGDIYEATVVRTVFAPSLSLTPSSPCPNYAMTQPVAPSGEMVVTVFYTCGVDGPAVPTYRVYPTTTASLRTALDQLLAGPTSAEQAAGLTSWFSSATAGYLVGVTVSSGNAVVDLSDLRAVIPNASTSAGSHMLLAQLDATVFQFPTVTTVLYRIDGSCQLFGEWLQLDGCVPRARTTG